MESKNAKGKTKMKDKNIRKGQSTLEYAVVIVVVVAALLAMQIYMKRGVQGKLRESTDSIGEQFDAKHTSNDFTTTRSGTTVQFVGKPNDTATADSSTRGVTYVYSGANNLGSADITQEHGSETVEALSASR